MKLTVITITAVAVGAYARWSVQPAMASYRIGRRMERLVANPARYVPAFRAGYVLGRNDRLESLD